MDQSQESPVLINRIRLRNLLSFGRESAELELRPLNLLVGPNGAGKSNLIEAICLLRGCASSLTDVVRRSGGAREWIWKGAPDEEAVLEVVLANAHGSTPLRHALRFAAEGAAFRLRDERIETAEPYQGHSRPHQFYAYRAGHPMIKTRRLDGQGATSETDRDLAPQTVKQDVSIVAQFRDPELYPVITYFGEQYEGITAYREWAIGRHTPLREPQSAAGSADRLEEDYSNLGVFLNRLRGRSRVKQQILRALGELYEGAEDVDVRIDSGTVQVFIQESGFDTPIPASRLSDGTLRYLCLLAVLYDPNPPPLICIEEPELGLHPDVISGLAEILVDASTRTQLIVTTHSDVLIDAMTENPEAVIVCEKHSGQTQMARLSEQQLQTWLAKYRLGELWRRGDIGGNRW